MPCKKKEKKKRKKKKRKKKKKKKRKKKKNEEEEEEEKEEIYILCIEIRRIYKLKYWLVFVVAVHVVDVVAGWFIIWRTEGCGAMKMFTSSQGNYPQDVDICVY